MICTLQHLLLFNFLILSSACFAQNTGSIIGSVQSKTVILAGANVKLEGTNHGSVTDEKGNFIIQNIPAGKYMLTASIVGFKTKSQNVTVRDQKVSVIHFDLDTGTIALGEVTITTEKENTFGITRLKSVEGTAIYAGKKSEVIVLEDIVANTATNNSRQIFSKVAGLNIWESDGAGIQLGIGGRGLNPTRVSNFNTRQNGYDISADALGYPESYYTPPSEAVERIEIVRGAASLQYGTQFGGFINFKFKKGNPDKPLEVISRQTIGSFGLFNSFNSVGGTIKKRWNYYTFYQHKEGKGWRSNSGFDVNTAHASVNFKASDKLSFTGEYTYMTYLAQQAGGLTDRLFETDPQQSIRNRNWFKVNWNLAAFMIDYSVNEKLKFNTRFFALSADRSAVGILSFINRADPLTKRDLWIDKYNNWGNETRMIYNYTIKNNPSVLLIGGRYYNGFTHRTQGIGNSDSTGNRKDFRFKNPEEEEYSEFNFPSTNSAIFSENIFQLTPKLNIIPGIRWENIETYAKGYYNLINRDLAGNLIYNQRTDEERGSSRSFVLMGIGSTLKPNDKVEVYGNFSQNYRSINFNDMRIENPNIKVNPDLKDERGFSADAGLRGNMAEIINYDLSLFMIKYNDRIGSVLNIDSLLFNTYRYRTNVSDSRNIGLETFIEANILKLFNKSTGKTLSIFSNFSLIDARYINSEETAYQNKKVEMVPEKILKTGVTFKSKSFLATYQYSYTSEHFTDATNAIFTTNAVNGIIPSYYVMDLSIKYRYKRFELSGGVNNLTDNMYFTRRADGYPGPGIIPSDGRSFYLTLELKL